MDSEGEEYMDSNGDFEDNEDEYEGSDYDAAECSSDEYYVSENDDDHEDCEPNHSVLTESDVRKRQDDIITKVTSLLCISKTSASILLLNFNWSASCMDEWFAEEERVRLKVGLLEKPVVHPDGKKIQCRICFDNFGRRQMVSACCGHLFCKLCWERYVSTSIKDGPGCLTLRCPEAKCPAAVGQDIVDKLVSDEEKKKYSCFLLKSYVDVNKNIKWCPAPDCDNAVEFVAGSESYDVACNCKCNFCWNCLEETHRPVKCDTVAKWMIKNSAESENVTWILANSRPCPKCKRPIQKNSGCMHMTCTAPCKCEFCWLCLGSWTDHGRRTGGFYACNRYERAKKDGVYDEEERRREMAKSIIEKYTHYYERWKANDKSMKKAVADLRKMETMHMGKLCDGQGESGLQVKFITEAWLQIIECRRVLKWTYAYGYYLPERENTKRQLFEYLQGEAESWLERLHECTEKDLQKYLTAMEPSKEFTEFRVKLSGLTKPTKKYFEDLGQALENDLGEVVLSGACCWTGNAKGSGRNKKTVS